MPLNKTYPVLMTERALDTVVLANPGELKPNRRNAHWTVAH